MSTMDVSVAADVDAHGGKVMDRLWNLSSKNCSIAFGLVSLSCCPWTDGTHEMWGAEGVVGATSFGTLKGGFCSRCGCSRQCIQ